PRAQSFLFIDEVGRLASEGLRLVLEQARSAGIGCVMASQTLADMKTADWDLRHTLLQNTRFKQIFSEGDEEERTHLSRSSGTVMPEREWWMRGWNWKQTFGTKEPAVAVDSINQSPFPAPRITTNQIITVGDDALSSIAIVESGSGYSQWAGFSNV